MIYDWFGFLFLIKKTNKIGNISSFKSISVMGLLGPKKKSYNPNREVLKIQFLNQLFSFPEINQSDGGNLFSNPTTDLD